MTEPDTASRLAAYQLLNQADNEYYSGRAGDAAALMRRVDASPIRDEPRAVDLRAHLLSLRQQDLARQMLVDLMPAPDVILDAYIQLIVLDLKAGLLPQAVATMRFARGVLHDPQELYPTDLLVLREAKLNFEKTFVLGRCYIVGDDVLSAECKTAAGA